MITVWRVLHASASPSTSNACNPLCNHNSLSTVSIHIGNNFGTSIILVELDKISFAVWNFLVEIILMIFVSKYGSYDHIWQVEFCHKIRQIFQQNFVKFLWKITEFSREKTSFFLENCYMMWWPHVKNVVPFFESHSRAGVRWYLAY